MATSTLEDIVRFLRRTMFLIETEHLNLEELKKSLADEFRRKFPRDWIERYGEKVWYEFATEENEHRRR